MESVAAAAALMVSCGNTTPKARLRTVVDSLSYAYGVQSTNGLNAYINRDLKIDSIYLSEFYKGVVDGFNARDDKKRNAYYKGLQVGLQANQIIKAIDADLTSEDSVAFLSRDNFLAGFIDNGKLKGNVLSDRKVDSLITNVGDRLKDQNRIKKLKEKRKKSMDFIARKSKQAGAQKLPSGNYYKVLREGNGVKPSMDAVVKVKYEGKLANGKVFDSSAKQDGKPHEFRMGMAMYPGWDEALANMSVGSKWQLFVPQEQAYGERGAARIPPFSALEFTLELVDVIETDNNY
mgnify:CR=1 FL=1